MILCRGRGCGSWVEWLSLRTALGVWRGVLLVEGLGGDGDGGWLGCRHHGEESRRRARVVALMRLLAVSRTAVGHAGGWKCGVVAGRRLLGSIKQMLRRGRMSVAEGTRTARGVGYRSIDRQQNVATDARGVNGWPESGEWCLDGVAWLRGIIMLRWSLVGYIGRNQRPYAG